MPSEPRPHADTTAITAGRGVSRDSLAPVLFPATTYEVDTVADSEGRTFLLRRAQDQLRSADAIKPSESSTNAVHPKFDVIVIPPAALSRPFRRLAPRLRRRHRSNSTE